jgi:hypothetical protein
MQGEFGILIVLGAPPGAANGPSAEADFTDMEPGFSQPAVPHGSPQNKKNGCLSHFDALQGFNKVAEKYFQDHIFDKTIKSNLSIDQSR